MVTLIKRIGHVLASTAIALLSTGVMGAQQPRPNALPTTREVPSGFGVNSYTVTTVSAMSFYPGTNLAYGTSGSLGRYTNTNTLVDYYVGLDLPPGVIIDYIGLNSTTDTPFILGVELLRRNKFGSLSVIGNIDSQVHDWDTDINAAPIGYLWHGDPGEALVLHVQNGSSPNFQFFAWAEVWWKRSVSPAPLAPTFNDVSTGHPFYQFIEALAASGITGGCGNGNYCPDNPVTRAQMAVFLAKALGLHWGAD